jgi:hypothetical protein
MCVFHMMHMYCFLSSRDRILKCSVTCYTMQKSCFHRAVPTKAEESRSEPSQQKGGMFILRCSAAVGYTRYAISTTVERTFSGGCTIEATSWLYKRSGQQSLEVSSRESVFRKQLYERVCKEQFYESVLERSS